MSFSSGLSMPLNEFLGMMAVGTGETLQMVVLSMFFGYLVGLPLGILLFITEKNGLHPMPLVNRILNIVVNIVRSVPFLILLIFIIPFTRLLMGTFIGIHATIVPLTVAAIPFIARLVESSLKEVDHGVVEAAIAMGANNWTIIWRVLIRESLPSLVDGATLAITTILGYSAMAGATGGGGLGTIAINYGFYRYQKDVMLITVILLIIIVQIFQFVGTKIGRSLDRR